MELNFQRRAILEYREALRHYDQISLRLGDRFVAAMDVAMTRILADPTSHPMELGTFRRIRVKQFPYALFFQVMADDTVGVVAVSHTSRRPGYWRHRRFGS